MSDKEKSPKVQEKLCRKDSCKFLFKSIIQVVFDFVEWLGFPITCRLDHALAG